MWGNYWSPYSMYGGVSGLTHSPSSDYLSRVCLAKDLSRPLTTIGANGR